jgi:hypothetical protein
MKKPEMSGCSGHVRIFRQCPDVPDAYTVSGTTSTEVPEMSGTSGYVRNFRTYPDVPDILRFSGEVQKYRQHVLLYSDMCT